MALKYARRGDDTDAPISRGKSRGGRTGPDHAQHRQVIAASEVAESHRRGGVAGNHEGLHVAPNQGVERLDTERADLVVGSGAVRGASIVAEIDGRFGGRAAQDLAQDCEAAYS
jgi:hypothetical protein